MRKNILFVIALLSICCLSACSHQTQSSKSTPSDAEAIATAEVDFSDYNVQETTKLTLKLRTQEDEQDIDITELVLSSDNGNYMLKSNVLNIIGYYEEESPETEKEYYKTFKNGDQVLKIAINRNEFFKDGEDCYLLQKTALDTDGSFAVPSDIFSALGFMCIQGFDENGVTFTVSDNPVNIMTED